MNAKELEKILKKDGWECVNQKGSHKQYKHPVKSGKVTIPFHGHRDINIKTANTILKQAGINSPTERSQL